MIFVNNEVQGALKSVFDWYRTHYMGTLICNGEELKGDSFDTWFRNNKALMLDPESIIKRKDGSVVFLRYTQITLEEYKNDILVDNPKLGDVYSPMKVIIPVCYYYNDQIKNLIIYFNGHSDFKVSCAML